MTKGVAASSKVEKSSEKLQCRNSYTLKAAIDVGKNLPPDMGGVGGGNGAVVIIINTTKKYEFNSNWHNPIVLH